MSTLDSAPPRDRAIWVVNSNCPSRCVYCDIASQRRRSELDEAQALRVADQLVEAGFRQVIFVGGEPLLFGPLPQCLERLAAAGLETAVFTGGIGGDPQRWAERLTHATRVTLSIDAGTAALNDRIRGRLGTTADLTAMAQTFARELPDLDLSICSVVTRHNIDSLPTVWTRLKDLRPTAWVLILAGDNFEGSPATHFASREDLERLYLGAVGPLARMVGHDDPDTDFLVFPTPLPLLAGRVPPRQWDRLPPDLEAAVRDAVSDYARGDYNRAFVERFGCPLVGRDVTIGVSGEVYPCSQAPIIGDAYCIGNAKEQSVATLMVGEAHQRFRAAVPHAACHRCWAPSNVPPELLRRLLWSEREA